MWNTKPSWFAEPNVSSNSQKHESETITVKVKWAKAATELAVVHSLHKSSKICTLRKKLEESGKIPSEGRTVFIVNDTPLNMSQEVFCSLSIFGDGRTVTVPIELKSESLNPLPPSSSRMDTCRERVSFEQEKREALLADFSQILKELVSIGGRSCIANLFERVDKTCPTKVSIGILCNICSSSIHQSRISSLSKSHIFEMLEKFSARNKNESISYFDLSACLPKHLSLCEFQGTKIPREHDESREHCLKNLSEKIVQLEQNGLRTTVHKSKLMRRTGSNPQKQKHSLFKYEHKHVGADEKSDDDNKFLYEMLGLEGRIIEENVRTGQATFHAPVDLYALFSAKDKELSGRIPYSEVENLFQSLGCGPKHLGVSVTEFQDSLKAFKCHDKCYDYASIVSFLSPSSASESASRLESVLGAVRNAFSKDSFGAADSGRFFSKYDQEHSGKVSALSFKRLIVEDLKVHLSSKDMLALIDRFDPKRNGYISYSEFLALMGRGNAKIGELGPMRQRLVLAIRDQFFDASMGKVDFDRAFSFFDLDKDGVVSADNIVRAFEQLQRNSKLEKENHFLVVYAKENGTSIVPATMERILHCHPVSLSEAKREEKKNNWVKRSVKTGFDKSNFNALLNSANLESVNDIAKTIRMKLVELWNQNGQNLTLIYESLYATDQDRETEAKPFHGKPLQIQKLLDHSKINSSSLVRAMKESSQYILRVEDAHRFLNNQNQGETISKPRGLQELSDFIFPESRPTNDEIAARIRRTIKLSSIGGIRLRQSLENADSSRNGYLSKEELKSALWRLDIGLSARDIECFLSAKILKMDPLGKVSIEEVIRFALQTTNHVYRR